MLRTVGPSGSLFELLLPAGMRVLSGQLAEIDVLLDDERFFVPFRRFFDPVEGRPSIPIETGCSSVTEARSEALAALGRHGGTVTMMTAGANMTRDDAVRLMLTVLDRTAD